MAGWVWCEQDDEEGFMIPCRRRTWTISTIGERTVIDDDGLHIFFFAEFMWGGDEAGTSLE